MAGSVVAIGEILVEIMALDPGYGFREALRLEGPFPSGAPAIFIDQVGRLGVPAAMIGRVGDDDFGRLNIARLAASGVDVSGIAHDPGAVTGSAFVRYRPDGGRDFVFNIAASASGALTLGAAERRVLAGAAHLHVVGSSFFSARLREVIAEAIGAVKAAAGTISFDPNLRGEMLADPACAAALRETLGACDLFLPSAGEAERLTGAASDEAAITGLLAAGLGAAVLKRGAAGAIYRDRLGRIERGGFAVAEIDPTGAGDCFGATFIACRRRGLEAAVALDHACAAGALAVTRRGPMAGTAGLGEITALMAADGGRLG